jgi:hypothetical protein
MGHHWSTSFHNKISMDPPHSTLHTSRPRPELKVSKNFFAAARSLCGAGLVKRASAFAANAAHAHHTPSTKACAIYVYYCRTYEKSCERGERARGKREDMC